MPLLHALSNIERVFAKDLRGLRTLLYPGNYACRTPLHSVLADRRDLNKLFCSLWVMGGNASHELETHTSSPAFLAALSALNDLDQHNQQISDPSLAELIPTFVFSRSNQSWEAAAANPLERTLSKVKNLAIRRHLREKVNMEWGVPAKAPGALLVMHHAAKRATWRTSLNALGAQGRPEVLLLDATDASARSDYSASMHIPDFLLAARKFGMDEAGAVIVTDDPKTFFILRARMADSKLDFSTKVWAAEAQEALLSAQPVPSDWEPAQRSNSNFSVCIVDRDASQVALAFQRLTAFAGSEDDPAHKALLQACMYILRLSNMPAGYTDLSAAATEEGFDKLSNHNSWTAVKLALQTALASGSLNSVRPKVEDVIKRAEKLIDDWSDATPLASRLLVEVKKHSTSRRQSFALVLPSNKYVLLARRFLQRKLANDWDAVEPHMEWHTLATINRIPADQQNGRHFAFVGINADVLRILVTNSNVPHGTTILVAYQQAESSLKTLKSMKEIEAFKAYRGRIGLLAQQLEQRLSEVPNPIDIGKLREMSMTFKLDGVQSNGQSDQQADYKFDLEGGGRTYAYSWVYRYLPDEDPPFRRSLASTIQPGDFVFEMSDELRAKVESSLQLNSAGVNSIVDPVRMLLKLYHDDVQRRCALLFGAKRRSALARDIHAKMIELDARAESCRLGRVYYWLALQAKDDTRPHAAKDSSYFKVFCRALGIGDEEAEQHWTFVRSARRLNQYLGRELVARYAEILFQPESAVAYRKVPKDVIQELQQEALRCVYRVERVEPPSHPKGKTSVHS
ncbi:hypothetical protein [Dyella sp. ASV21]|uniref:hypothetical protein n=1 Tax=Dyella sp. ASV21 TaxID=2795114 RepID=UPI0018EA9122|nr:hypothetical protein [Dyella sp. ASV21]